MVAYARIEDLLTKRVSVRTGSNCSFYASIDMTLMEVEQSELDGTWYVAGFAPKKNEETKRREEVEALIVQHKAYLTDTDWYAIRFADTGQDIPAEVKECRQKARVEIDTLRDVLAMLEEKVIRVTRS